MGVEKHARRKAFETQQNRSLPPKDLCMGGECVIEAAIGLTLLTLLPLTLLLGFSIAYDVESTGKAPMIDRVVQICLTRVDDDGNREILVNSLVNPEMPISEGATEVHGITEEFLADKPVFARVADEFLDFIRGAELVIHNAPFDIGFMEAEFKLLDPSSPPVSTYCKVTDSLQLARSKHPGQRNNLDALCQRYAVDNSNRTLHGALLDAEILADVYLLMTGGQTSLGLSADEEGAANGATAAQAQPHLGRGQSYLRGLTCRPVRAMRIRGGTPSDAPYH